MSRNSEGRSVNNSQEKSSDPTQCNLRIKLLLSWFSTSREMEIPYEYRHFHGTSSDSRTVSDIQVVECFINLLSKFMASLAGSFQHCRNLHIQLLTISTNQALHWRGIQQGSCLDGCARTPVPLLVAGEMITVLGSPISGTYAC